MKEKTITLDRLVRWVGIGLLIIAIIVLIDYLSSVLLPFFIAWFFAYLLYPIVKFVERRMHLPRALRHHPDADLSHSPGKRHRIHDHSPDD